MLDKFLKEVVLITAGKSAEEIADLLNSRTHVNEFVLAKKMDMTINQVRNILYKISDKGLVSSIRKKDKKKGWYTYFWKFEVLKCLEFLKSLLIKSKEDIEREILSRSNNRFYYCDTCNLEYSEDQALLMEFTCDECGEIFRAKDNSKAVKELKKNLNKIKERLEIIDVEIEKEVKKVERKKDLQVKKEEKEKKRKREEARKKRQAQKKKISKKKDATKKKSAKKKVVKKKSKKKKAVKKKSAKKKVVKKKSKKKKAVKKKSAKKKR